MKIYFSPASPFVRKCLVAAAELGLPADSIEKLPSAAHPVNRDQSIIKSNPLGQVPTFIADDGQMMADSRVVCEYLDDLAKGNLFPKDATRWEVLRSEEHTSELQSLMRISYAVFCLKKKK